MSYCCSQCNFTAHFESALIMHHQLHHEFSTNPTPLRKNKSHTVPRESHLDRHSPSTNDNKGQKLLGRTSSATRLFDKLRARICKSKTLFSHPEEVADIQSLNDLSLQSQSTSKKSKVHIVESPRETLNETFACHLCPFDADRITVLDRHLLNDHKIGLDALLKLVMAKTKDGLSDENTINIGIRQPYYKIPDELIQEGEFIIETVSPKIKILKHASINTELKWTDIPNLEDCKHISEEIEKIIDVPMDGCEKRHLLNKMQTLNECMSKFVDSSNNLKKVLTKELSHKNLGRPSERAYLGLGLGDQDSPRHWERPHSEQLDKNRSTLGENRSDKVKYPSESFYF